jgi:hypothetical protein
MQADLWFQSEPGQRMSSRTAKTIQRNPVSKNKTKQNKTKQNKIRAGEMAQQLRPLTALQRS